MNQQPRNLAAEAVDAVRRQAQAFRRETGRPASCEPLCKCHLCKAEVTAQLDAATSVTPLLFRDGDDDASRAALFGLAGQQVFSPIDVPEIAMLAARRSTNRILVQVPVGIAEVVPAPPPVVSVLIEDLIRVLCATE